MRADLWSWGVVAWELLAMRRLFAGKSELDTIKLMSEATIGWLLLEAAVIAEKAAAEVPDGHPDRAFYSGKRYAAQYFANNVLPTVAAKAALIAKEERTPIEIPARD